MLRSREWDSEISMDSCDARVWPICAAGRAAEKEHLMRSRRVEEAEFVIPKDRVDARDYIDSRLRSVPEAVRGATRTTLQYLYLLDGPRDLPADRKRLAEPYLQTAERIVVRWLHPRTNGQYRRTYGYPALRAARMARYRCERCG